MGFAGLQSSITLLVVFIFTLERFFKYRISSVDSEREQAKKGSIITCFHCHVCFDWT